MTSIGDSAFHFNQLTSVALGSSVVTIGTTAFSYNQLTSVTIPDSVTSIGDGAFSYNQLTSATLGSSVVTVGTFAFANNQLVSVVIPSSVSVLDASAFRNNNLASFTIEGDPAVLGTEILRGNNVQTISYNGTVHTAADPTSEACFDFNPGTGMITGFHQVDLYLIKSGGPACLNTALIVPSLVSSVAVTGIGSGAFQNLHFDSVVVPDSVVTIGAQAFFASSIDSLVLGNGVVTIGTWAFRQNQLTSLVIPDSVTDIHSDAFAFNQITSLTLGNSTQTIYHDAFESNQIAEVFIPSSVEYLASTAFAFQGGGWSNPEGVFYTRLILEDPSNPNGLTDSTFDTTWALYGEGGHLINAVPFSLVHQNSASEELAPSVFMAGPTLTSYLASDNPTGDYSLYYRVGDEVTYTPPAVNGYVSPALQSYILPGPSSPIVLTYYTQAELDGNTDTGSGSGVGTLADTGVSFWMVLGGAVAMIGVSAVLTRVRV